MKDQNFPEMKLALSYPVHVRSLPVKGLRVVLSANSSECEALAQNHGLREVKSCSSEFQLMPWKKRGVRLKGVLKADIVQSCIVTLDPIENTIEEKIEVVFVPDDSRLAKPRNDEHTGELFIDADGPDIPEVFHGDTIDIGAVTEEFFELAIDAYPRKEGLDAVANMQEEVLDKKPSPFAILKDLK